MRRRRRDTEEEKSGLPQVKSVEHKILFGKELICGS